MPEASLQRFFPEADRFDAVTGDPPAVAVYRGDQLIGYGFSSRQVIGSTGYSAKPLDVLVGLDPDGIIVGAEIIEHHEPILIIGVSDQDLARFVGQYQGHDIRETLEISRWGGAGPGTVDGVSGATISSVVINDAILRTARAVARDRGLLGSAQATLDFDSFAVASWDDLLAEDSLVELTVTVGDALAAVERAGGRLFPEQVPIPDHDSLYLQLFFGLATPARVGRNLIGDRDFNRILADQPPEAQIVFVAGRGLASFKGPYRRSGLFERLQLIQDDETIVFRLEDHIALEDLHLDGAPELRELALFVVPAEATFDPRQPWRLELVVAGEDEQDQAVLARFDGNFVLPARYVRPAAAPESGPPELPLWVRNWQGRQAEIAVLVLGLTVLTGILVFQSLVARRRRLYLTLRIGFLAFTLFCLGWLLGAQLSVLNVLTFANAMMTDFSWDFFLLEPLIFILWAYVAVALLFWGRGVFCGWLCPFGALQELTNRLAKWAKLPQWRLPFALHERLWPIKYMIFLGLFAVFLKDPALAMVGAEVEPFKTAIVFKFDRAWPYVLFVLVILAAGLFVPRVYCRYLCPLGAALAIPARIRMFEWLKRRWQCGTPCQQCAQACPVQAIHPEGKINPNECIHCLNCQVNYFDDRLCPPLIERRKRREARQARKTEVKAT